MAEMTMRWQRQKLNFRSLCFEVEHFDVAEVLSSSSDDSADDAETRELRRSNRTKRREKDELLARCETELGACLWLDTNLAILQVLQDWRDSYDGLRVLELGAGTGALGIALALDGAHATVSDLPTLLPLLQSNVQLNELPPPPPELNPAAETPQEDPECVVQVNVNFVETGTDAEGEEHEVTTRVKAKGRKAKSSVEGSLADEAAVSNRSLRAGAKGRKQAGPRQRASRVQAAADAASLAKAKTKVGTCQALPVEWGSECRSPTLPASAFGLVVVCDCLYENQESWDALQLLLTRVMEPEAVVALASAMIRKPFLEAFTAQLEAAGFKVVRREEGQRLGEISTAILQRSDI